MQLTLLFLRQTLVTIVIVSRLVYRKGVDLLAGAIPILCRKYPNVNFLIGGDGPKRITLEEVRENHQLQDRVVLLGTIEHEKVRNVLVKGDIFLNASLTEAFCMAIVEAAACGLQVVSTRVGGIPEVLPADMVWLTEPTIAGLVDGIDRAITDRLRGRFLSPSRCHQRISQMYRWSDVARRTEIVYGAVTKQPVENLKKRLKKLRQIGCLSGSFFVMVAIIIHFMMLVCNWLLPEKLIEKAQDFTETAKQESKEKGQETL